MTHKIFCNCTGCVGPRRDTKLTDKQRKVMKISDAILEVVDMAQNATDLPRGDLQGVVEALAMQIVNESEA